MHFNKDILLDNTLESFIPGLGVVSGHITNLKPTVKNTMAADIIKIIKHNATFSLQACKTPLSLNSGKQQVMTNPGAQQVTILAKQDQGPS
jgi:hypothetical protein